MSEKAQNIAFGALGFCLYRSAATFMYNTAIGSTETSTGFISGLQFVYIANLSAILAALLVVMALKLLNLRLPSFCNISVAVACLALLASQASAFLPIATFPLFLTASILCGTSLLLLCSAWLNCLMSQKSISIALFQIVFGNILNIATGTILLNAPPLIASFLSAVFLILSAAIMRKIGGDIPPSNPASYAIPKSERFTFYSVLLGFFVLVAVVGAMHTSVLGSDEASMVADVPMPITRIISIAIFACLSYLMSTKIHPTLIFRAVFPTLIVIISLLPFFGQEYRSATGLAYITAYQVCGMVFFFFLIREGRRLSLSSYLLGSIYILGSSGFLIIGLSVGLAVQQLSSAFDLSVIALLVFVAIYPLALVFMLLSQRKQTSDRPRGDMAGQTQGETEINAPLDITEAVDAIAQRHGLTNREKAVLEYLARGRSIKYIAETLVISENTASTHSKRIYAKANVHSKQELISLVESELNNPLDKK